jgi:hypothetical protein
VNPVPDPLLEAPNSTKFDTFKVDIRGNMASVSRRPDSCCSTTGNSASIPEKHTKTANEPTGRVLFMLTTESYGTKKDQHLAKCEVALALN